VDEAVQTIASTAEIWAMVVVVVIVLVFMISAPLMADLMQHRENERARRDAALGRPRVPAPRGRYPSGQYPGELPRQRPAGEALAGAGGRQSKAQQNEAGRHRRAPTVSEGEAPTRPDLPAQSAQSAQSAAGRHEMPRQRAGEADRAGRSYAGQDGPDEDGRR
jgi:hypothetical protein